MVLCNASLQSPQLAASSRELFLTAASLEQRAANYTLGVRRKHGGHRSWQLSTHDVKRQEHLAAGAAAPHFKMPPWAFCKTLPCLASSQYTVMTSAMPPNDIAHPNGASLVEEEEEVEE